MSKHQEYDSPLARLVLPEIRELLAEGDFETPAEILRHWEPADLARLLGELAFDSRLKLIHVLEPGQRAALISYLPESDRLSLLHSLPDDELGDLLNRMPPDDRTRLLAEFEPAVRQRYLDLLAPEEKAVALSLLGYPEASVGRLMTPDFVAVHPEWTVEQALAHIRKTGRDSETLNVIYVIDDKRLLVDDLRIREILLAAPHRKIEELMNRQYVALRATHRKEDAVNVFREYDRVALPVLDDDGRLMGMVTLDDVIDVAEERATREIQKFGGLEALEDPYLATPFLELIQKRAGWLVILFVGEMFTAQAMGYFEKEIESAVVLALFVPLIISSGGNSGSQAATLIIRALALREITLGDWWLVMRREILSGLALGCVLGAIGFARIGLWTIFTDIYGPHWLLVAITVALSLILIVLWGTVTGSLLPIVLKYLGIDPATSSAPFVATLVDVTGLVIYFSVAHFILMPALQSEPKRKELLPPHNHAADRLSLQHPRHVVAELLGRDLVGEGRELRELPGAGQSPPDFQPLRHRALGRVDAIEGDAAEQEGIEADVQIRSPDQAIGRDAPAMGRRPQERGERVAADSIDGRGPLRGQERLAGAVIDLAAADDAGDAELLENVCSFTAGRDHAIAELREDADRDTAYAAAGARHHHLARLGPHAVSFEGHYGLAGGEAGGAIDHRVTLGESGRQRHDPIGRDANPLAPPAPLRRAEFIARDNDRVARLEAAAGALLDHSGRVDARHVRQLPRHARMPGRGESVLVVHAGPVDADHRVARRESVEGHGCKLAARLAGGVAGDNIGANC